MATTLAIDEQILNIDKVICRHIDNLSNFSRGEVSQDILAQLRNFVEHIMLKIYAKGQDIDINYENICKAINFVKKRGELKDLSRFHARLQYSVSHYTPDEESSERLMLKYLEDLLKIKKFLYDKFKLQVLNNIDKYPIHQDSLLQEYYTKIVDKIKSHGISNVKATEKKYYIRKIKPFFVDNQIYYEISFVPARDYESKFNRITAFTSLDISENYAVNFSLVDDSIDAFDGTMPIVIINGWRVAIRTCEYENFAKILTGKKISIEKTEQRAISALLTQTGLYLSEIVNFSDENFQVIKMAIAKRAKKLVFFEILERCRDIIKTKSPGANLLLYLLFHMNNMIIKKQYDRIPKEEFSGLYVDFSSMPFDNIPFNFFLKNHKPRFCDLLSCIDSKGREHEILARAVKINTEFEGQLFTPVKELECYFNDIPKLVKIYNDNLYHKHRESAKLEIKYDRLFINGYLNDTKYIIDQLKKFAQKNVQNYSNSVRAWLEKTTTTYNIDCEEKRQALIKMFENSRVALIYGSAGTGKTTLIDHVAHFFSDKKKIFLAHTNPAVDNLRRRVTALNSHFYTTTKFIMNQSKICDLLVIDECSTVSNDEMRDILNKATYKLLLLVGDPYQIESIRFGNWFSFARSFVPETSVFELTNPYRTKNKNLLTLWEKARNMDETLIEHLTRQGYSSRLDNSIFIPSKEDEIVLCLNYDGLYGINNINRFLQENNPNPPVHWDIERYKVNDPVLFNELKRFMPVIYNNLKGKIVGIAKLDEGKPSERIQFDIEIDKVINEIDTIGRDFELVGSSVSGNSIIRFCVKKHKTCDEDDDSLDTVVPFQIAYAVSIHKAQGLEYDSVKLIITDEVEELITHNIFYTAITRAREELKIYCTPEVEKRVLNRIKPKTSNKDVRLFNKISSNY